MRALQCAQTLGLEPEVPNPYVILREWLSHLQLLNSDGESFVDHVLVRPVLPIRNLHSPGPLPYYLRQ